MTTEAPYYRITDHALLRWLERVHGIDVEWFREMMLVEVQASVVGFGGFPDETAEQFVLDGDTVITILLPEHRLSKKHRHSFAVPRLQIPATA